MHVQLIRSHGRGVWLEREHLHSLCIAITLLLVLRRTINHRMMKARARRENTFVVDRFIIKSNGHHYHLAIGSTVIVCTGGHDHRLSAYAKSHGVGTEHTITSYDDNGSVW